MIQLPIYMLFFGHLVCENPYMNQDFDWNDLRVFLAIMRTGKLTGAARRLKVDHTTLGRRISRLEKTLKVKLFDRLTVGYRPTTEAERLLADAEAIETITADIHARFTNEISELSGAVRIAAPEGFGTYFLALRMSSFQSAYPNVEVEMIARPSLVSLSKREAEMAVTNVRPTTGALHTLKLTDYELGVYASKSYLSNAAPIRQPSDFESHRFVGYIDDMLPTPEHDYMGEISKAIAPEIRFSNILTQMAATKGGAGLCVLPCFMADRDADLERLATDAVRIHRSYWLVIQSDTRRLARVRVAADFIVAAVLAERDLFLPDSTKR